MEFNQYFDHLARTIGVNPDYIEAPIVVNGTFRRFSTGRTKRSDSNGYYLLRERDGLIVGTLGCWKTGRNSLVCWTPQGRRPLRTGELAQRQQQMQRLRQELSASIEAEQAARYARGARTAAHIVATAVPASTHPYLSKKRIRAHEGLLCLVAERLLVIPLLDIHGKLQTLQTIAADGTKRFMQDGQTRGACHVIGTLPSASPGQAPSAKRLLVCEGYATGATLREHTGDTVVCAMTAGNLQTIALALRAQYPTLDNIIIAADNDRFTAGNPGLCKAREAAQAAQALMTYPVFPQGSTTGTDYNDLVNMGWAI